MASEFAVTCAMHEAIMATKRAEEAKRKESEGNDLAQPASSPQENKEDGSQPQPVLEVIEIQSSSQSSDDSEPGTAAGQSLGLPPYVNYYRYDAATGITYNNRGLIVKKDVPKDSGSPGSWYDSITDCAYNKDGKITYRHGNKVRNPSTSSYDSDSETWNTKPSDYESDSSASESEKPSGVDRSAQPNLKKKT